MDILDEIPVILIVQCSDMEISDNSELNSGSSEPNSELNPEPNSEPSSEPDSVSNSEPNSESNLASSSEPKSEPNLASSSELKSEPNLASSAELKPEPNLASSSEPNFEPAAEDFITAEMEESEDVVEPKPSCSRRHIKPQTKPELKSRDIKPDFPWKFLLPTRGISKIIFQIVSSTETRKGISLQGIKKCVVATGYDLEKRKNYFRRVLRGLLAKGLLKKLTGRGLTGSYAVSEMMRKVLWMKKNQGKKMIMAGSERKSAPQEKKRPRKKVKGIEFVMAPGAPVSCEIAVAC